MKRLINSTVALVILITGIWIGRNVEVPTLPASAQGSCQTFKETGKTVCGKFLQYWQAHGGLAQQGLPLSSEFIEVSDSNGKSYTVQYFERAVFELHPENKPPFDVLLSQLGTFQLQRKYPSGPPVASPPAQVSPSPQPGVSPPTSETAFAEYILQKYPNIGPCKLADNLRDVVANGNGAVHNVDIMVASQEAVELGGQDVFNCIANAAPGTQIRAWANAVLTEAKHAWGTGPFLVRVLYKEDALAPRSTCHDFEVGPFDSRSATYPYTYFLIEIYQNQKQGTGISTCRI